MSTSGGIDELLSDSRAIAMPCPLQVLGIHISYDQIRATPIWLLNHRVLGPCAPRRSMDD